MNRDTTHRQNESQPHWEAARSRTSSELLAILAPTADEPAAIQRAGIWKTGTLGVPAPESAA